MEKKKKVEDAHVLSSARQDVEQWRQILTRVTSLENQMQEPPLMRWNPPSMGYVKCNIDGPIFETRGLIIMILIM